MKASFVAIASLALAPRAYAGPCDTAARVLLAQHAAYVTYCPECGDPAPSAPATWTAPQPLPDLAHTYVRTSASSFELAATLDGCYVTGLPRSLRVVDETATGVLIVPDELPSRRLPELIPSGHAAEPTPLEVPAWIACAIGGLAGSGVTVTLLGRRRRRFVPRAIDLAVDDSRVRIDRCAD